MAAQAGLCLAWSETPEDTFCHVVAQIHGWPFSNIYLYLSALPSFTIFLSISLSYILARMVLISLCILQSDHAFLDDLLIVRSSDCKALSDQSHQSPLFVKYLFDNYLFLDIYVCKIYLLKEISYPFFKRSVILIILMLPCSFGIYLMYSQQDSLLQSKYHMIHRVNKF